MLTGLDAAPDNKVLADVAALVGAAKGTSTVSGSSKAAARAVAPVPVLAPGLYELVYDPVGTLTGLKAVSYFCSKGVQTTPC